MTVQETVSKAWRKRIEQEYLDLTSNEEHLHNQMLHKEILATWKQSSPKMYRRLFLAGIVDKLAYVLQERMFQEMDKLMAAGYPPTDARETAERIHLMLEPEESQDEAEIPS